jgi:hypothetical protein
MNKIVLIMAMCLGLTGCSLLPRITMDKAGVTPTSTEKSQKKEICAGEYKTDSTGKIISCTKGYYNYEQNYAQVERAYTFSEKVANFIRGLAGWSFWLLVLALFLVPGLAGWLIGRVFNVFRDALTGTVRAITSFRSKIPTITVSGIGEIPDPTYVKAVDALLDELEAEHSADPAILKTILDIRTKLKIAKD